MKCPDLELNVLLSMEDVTARVTAAIKPGMSDKQANDARKAAMAEIEKGSLDTTGLRSDVGSLYQGGEYWFYRYKNYTDIRLVFAPEVQIAFYGGDPDSFTSPRYDLDMALFRVYENDKPIKSPAVLKWNQKGVGDGELVFISGQPGSTDRLRILAQLEMSRDYSYPRIIELVTRQIDVARRSSARGAEPAREAADLIFGLENGLKAISCEYQGLKDPQLMAKKARAEQEFRALVAARPELNKPYASAWDDIAAAIRVECAQRNKRGRLQQAVGAPKDRSPEPSSDVQYCLGGAQAPKFTYCIVSEAEETSGRGARWEEREDSRQPFLLIHSLVERDEVLLPVLVQIDDRELVPPLEGRRDHLGAKLG